jgi:tryptophan synthase alpha chain
MLLSPISLAFKKSKEEKRTALLTYTVAGDNTKKKSLEILNAVSKYVDICEIGFPHNTPIADGGQIQTSASRAIKNGIKMKDVFQIVNKFKKNKNKKPVILMGYYNMILQYGQNKFLKKCKQVGVNGLIVVDLPWPDNKVFAKKCKNNFISFIQLLSPTTSKIRMKKIINSSHDMIYYISMLSTTGGKLKVSPREILKNYGKIKKIIKNRKKNLVIGFGITSKNISSLKKADGLVVGSSLCQEISKSIKNRQNPVTKVSNMVKRLRTKLS